MSDPININLRRYDGKWSNIVMSKEERVDILYEKVRTKTGMEVSQFELLFASNALAKGTSKTIKECHILNDSQVFMIMQLPGGSDVFKGKTIEWVYDATDMILCENDRTVPKAKMPCGHFITKESLTMYCKSELASGKSTFVCPANGCGEEFPYWMIRQTACLSEEERRDIETRITRNKCETSPDIRECPKCGSYSKRVDSSNQRAVCPVCSKGKSTLYEFCWDCMAEWNTKNHTNCKDEFARKYLSNCGTKTITRVDDCYKARACPKCYTLIDHTSGCKQMTCANPSCKCSFCFVCLKQAVNGNWQCGDWNTVCEVAPIQTKDS